MQAAPAEALPPLLINPHNELATAAAMQEALTTQDLVAPQFSVHRSDVFDAIPGFDALYHVAARVRSLRLAQVIAWQTERCVYPVMPVPLRTEVSVELQQV